MSSQYIQKFSVIGISVRTTNKNQQAATDIAILWKNFIQENILEQIPNKIDNSIFCIYTDYEKDYTEPYTTILGCKVSSLDNIPFGMVARTFDSTFYEKFIVEGDLSEGIVFNQWLKIWNSDLNRAYSADFEVYSGEINNLQNSIIEIFIALK